jgi:hypothetical protein
MTAGLMTVRHGKQISARTSSTFLLDLTTCCDFE